ncbi:MAG: CbbX protein [Gammaproteobacteria bacterium]|nr:CbbX protein [Gammaproteobacteria bacterium]
MATTAGQQTSTGDAQVSVAGAFRDSEVEEVLDKLDRELVGLKPVKTRIREIAALLMVDRLRKGMGLSSGPPSLHMSFTGNPGTGKTTVAMRMAEILHRLGYIRRPEVVSVTRDDLVGQYIGHTAPKTKEVLKKAMGGVLFIDEAYYLYRPENERDYGQESIEILLQVMENQRDDLVVILAGYKDRMDTFFKSNPGMASRVAHHLDFPDFAADELMQITHLMLQQQQYRLSPQAEQAFYDYIQRRMKMPQFANARSIRNALDRARLRQANRLYAKGGALTREQLMTLETEDIMVSRVFREGKPDGLKEEAETEKKSLENARVAPGVLPPATLVHPYTSKVDNPVASTPDARREATSEPHHAIQDSPMQTNMKPDESAQHNSLSADAGFGGMPHTLPPAQSGSGWQKRTKRAHAARPAQPPAPLREPPKVVNGRCEFGQCENETQQEDTGQRASVSANIKPMPLTEQASDSRADAATGFGVPRELHAPRVVVRRVSNMRKKAARDRTPQPLPQINRPEPVVVNGRCEFGQCEAPPKVEEASTTGGQIVTGTLVERSAKVTGNEPGSCKKVTGTEYIGPDQYTALCAGEPYVPPAKVGATHTVGGAQRVTGTEVGPSIKVTGDEPGTCKRITGVEYLGAENHAQLCDAQGSASVAGGRTPGATDTTPGAPAPKTGVTRTVKNKAVTGTQVGTSPKVTGDEPGSCKHVTGDEYLNPAAADVPCADAQSPGPAKVNVSRTTHGRTVTGTLVGGSAKITGDEYGACHGITGTEYIGAELQKQLCGTEPAASPAKVGVARTWQDQPVSGTQVGRSEKVTGDEYGACKGVTGTPYVGPDRYEEFCDAQGRASVAGGRTPVATDAQGRASVAGGRTPGATDTRDVQTSAARVVAERKPAGHAMTGIQPGVKGKMTGDERGACLSVTGTPYMGDDQYSQACASQGGLSVAGGRTPGATVTDGAQPVAQSAKAKGAFSVTPPVRVAHAVAMHRVTGTVYDGATSITGPLAKSAGMVTGTAEFRQPAHGAAQVQKTDAPGRASVAGDGMPGATETKSRVTGEGTEARRITGDDWARNERVTGTEGTSSTARNLTQRGQPRGVQANARRFREVEHPEAPPSKVTGSSGSAMSGSLITVSGGARG